MHRPAPRFLALATVGAVGLVTIVAGCNDDGRTLDPAGPDQTASVYTTTTIAAAVTDPLIVDPEPTVTPTTSATTATSTTDLGLTMALVLPWDDGGTIDARFTCSGDDAQPAVLWTNPPADAVEMAIAVIDLDAENFVHWAMAGLVPAESSVGENDVPVGAIEGANSFSTAGAEDLGWRGPCPPSGQTHRYEFTLYALDQFVELPTGAPGADLIALFRSTALATATITASATTP